MIIPERERQAKRVEQRRVPMYNAARCSFGVSTPKKRFAAVGKSRSKDLAGFKDLRGLYVSAFLGSQPRVDVIVGQDQLYAWVGGV